MRKIIVLALCLNLVPVLGQTNCGNGNGNGNGCSDGSQTGPQGPKGEKGETGLSGTNGTNGTNGNPGVAGQSADSSNVSNFVGVEVEWLQKGRFSISSGYEYDIVGKQHVITAARLNIRIGNSEEDKALNDMRHELDAMKHRLSEISRVQDTFVTTGH